MPLYEIEHVCPINPDQQQSIANAIVKIHSEMFTTPSLFVNVRFKDTNATPLFVAGKRVSPNILAGRGLSYLSILCPSKVVLTTSNSNFPVQQPTCGSLDDI
jgi:hypothetical protein